MAIAALICKSLIKIDGLLLYWLDKDKVGGEIPTGKGLKP